MVDRAERRTRDGRAVLSEDLQPRTGGQALPGRWSHGWNAKQRPEQRPNNRASLQRRQSSSGAVAWVSRPCEREGQASFHFPNASPHHNARAVLLTIHLAWEPPGRGRGSAKPDQQDEC